MRSAHPRRARRSPRLAALRWTLAAWALPGVAIAAPSTLEPVQVQIDVSAIKAPDGEGIEKEVRARIGSILAEHGYTMREKASDSVEIRIDYTDEEGLEYGIHVEVYDEGELVLPADERMICQFCPTTMVADRVGDRLPGALDRLTAANEAQVPLEEPIVPEGEPPEDQPPEDQPPEDQPPEDQPPPRRDKPLSPLGKLGIPALAVGLVTTGVGAAVFAQGRQLDNPAGRLVEAQERNFRPPGALMMVGGGILAVTGFALIIADRLRVRRSAKEARLRVVPKGMGVAFVTRF